MRFCLLEQYLPDGPKHPFAQKMIEHFQKLNTPLHSVFTYPKLEDQERRFARAGYPSVTARSLWDAWCDPFFTSPMRRKLVGEVEPFDEWEEFVLFASHYFLLVASTNALQYFGSSQPKILTTVPDPEIVTYSQHDKSINASLNLTLTSSPLELLPNQRRFGVVFKAPHNVFGFHGGLGKQCRSSTTDFLSVPTSTNPKSCSQGASMQEAFAQFALPSAIEPRMCHTISRLADGKYLLIGGRASPERPLMDCWFFSKSWQRVHDLPIPLYRHCAVCITFGHHVPSSHGILVFGGVTLNQQLSRVWLLWQESSGWQNLGTCESAMTPVFGASIVATGPLSGILFGGMTEYGSMSLDIWQWSLSPSDMYCRINISKCTFYGPAAPKALARFGAQLVPFSKGFLLIGGVSNSVLGQTDEIVYISKAQTSSTDWNATAMQYQSQSPRSLLVGHSAASFEGGVLFMGGGAVCFSFGTFWNHLPVFLSTEGLEVHHLRKRPSVSTDPTKTKGELRASAELASIDRQQLASLGSSAASAHNKGTDHHRNTLSSFDCSSAPLSKFAICRILVAEASGFAKIQADGKPVIISGMDLGSCSTKWTLEELRNKVGADREVVVHQATDQHMDFLHKNFVYTKKPFGLFVDEVSQGSKQYLRSLSADKPSGKAANLANDFPELAQDFVLPPSLRTVIQNMHSSVLRISGPVIMWLHYDVGMPLTLKNG